MMDANSLKDIIVVSGIPGSGKTTYCQHLKDDHGYYYIEFDHDELGLSRPFLPPPNGAGPATKDNMNSLAASHGNLVLEWGFPAQWLDSVTHLGRLGARLIWFEGDTVLCREAFRVAKKNDPSWMQTFEVQTAGLRSASLPTTAFQSIDVFDGTRHLTHKEIDRRVIPRGQCQQST